MLLRLKREFSSPKHKSDVYYLEAVERTRNCLEKLGHSEGRDTKKFTAYAMIILGVCILLASGVKAVFF